MSLNLQTLERLKWIYPAAVASDTEAQRLLDEVVAVDGPLQSLWKDANPYLFWQAFANVSLVRNGFDPTYTKLMSTYDRLMAVVPRDYTSIEGVVSALVLLTSREKRIDDQSRSVNRFVADFPNSLFGKINLVRAAIFSGEIERAESLFRQLIMPLPLETSLNEKLYWGSILLMHEELLPMRDAILALVHTRRISGALQKLAVNLQLYRPGGMKPDPASQALCVSLPADHVRFEASRKILRKVGIQSQKVVGVAGAFIPMTVRRQSACYDIGGGEYGCFVSHVAIWEKVAQASQPMLVLEDDAMPAYPFFLPEIIAALPKDAELVFVNDRSCVYLDKAENDERFLPIRAMNPERVEQATLLGSDGYILTKAGAQRLLAIYRSATICLPLDWHLFAASYEGHFSNRIFPAARTKRIFEATQEHGHVVAYGLTRPIVTSIDLDYSPLRANS